jgi:hypothetical protein
MNDVQDVTWNVFPFLELRKMELYRPYQKPIASAARKIKVK